MRDRRQPECKRDAHAVQDLLRDASVARIFSPSDLDIDDLAEAIRLLLGTDGGPQIASARRPDADLLSFPRRGTHVVEANETI